MSRTPLPPAPGAEEHPALDLADTRMALPADQCSDLLETPEAATEWLRQRDLVPVETELLPYCQSRLTALREELRELLAAKVDQRPPSEESLDALNRALTAAPAVSVLGHDPQTGFMRLAEHPVTRLVEHAMAQVAQDAVDLLTDQEGPQLARCQAEPCDRFFLRTHARRHWCSTRCGDRVRAARAYARRQQVGSADGDR